MTSEVTNGQGVDQAVGATTDEGRSDNNYGERRARRDATRHGTADADGKRRKKWGSGNGRATGNDARNGWRITDGAGRTVEERKRSVEEAREEQRQRDRVDEETETGGDGTNDGQQGSKRKRGKSAPSRDGRRGSGTGA